MGCVLIGVLWVVLHRSVMGCVLIGVLWVVFS